MALKHADVIEKMSLDEKVSLLSGKDFWQSVSYPKYSIPAMFLSDGPTGLRKQAAAADHLGLNPSIPATCFPTSATSANSWDPSLSQLVGQTIGEEAAVARVSVLLAPGVNMKRNPRCGRNFEYFSEDPYLAGKMAAGYIKGVQSNGVSACIKHFACNNQEIKRMSSDSVVDERALREIYLTAFEIAVKEAKPGCVMSAYNRINGTYCNENEHLLKDILRKEWGFKGLVVTDWGGDNNRVKGLECSNELEMPSTDGETNEDVKRAVLEGLIPVSLVDESVDRIIERAILSNEALKNAPKSFDKQEHHDRAYHVEQESIVLLKNDNDILPLKKSAKVAIIGDFAKTPRYQGAGSSMVNPLKVENVLDEVKNYDLKVVGYEPGFKRFGKKSQSLVKKACKLAEKADYVLLFIGLDEFSETEGIDRKNIRLPENQRILISALYHIGVPVIGVLSCGSAIEMPFIDRLNALVHGYLSGEGGARAMLDVLTGKVNPSGKLAETYPYGYLDVPSADHFGKNDTQIQYRESVYIGYRYFSSANVDVRYPFGYGLSYTKFKYSALKVDEKGVKFTLTNIGKVEGKEVAEMYIGKKDSKIFRPAIELKGFQKVNLKPGESQEVSIPFDDYSFRYFNVKTNSWEKEGGTYEVYVGPSSAELTLKGRLSVEGTTEVLPYEKKNVPHYFDGHVRSISNEEFEALLGHPLPEDKNLKGNRIMVDYETSVSDCRKAKGWFGRFFERVLRHLIWFLAHIGQRGTANTLTMGVYYNPLRNMSRMSGGMICWKQLDGLILMCNGHFFKGLHKFFKEGRLRKKEKKAAKKALAEGK
ncbi:MAG: glycoside hydrolase family 3 C-terminal domain-containing protein [Bacilli bacterium]|jgi:beta-glucosidase|nr:glycoside hydrolase family 3 C-terminal domain-containing protein [Bacilli bacterium]MCH4211032.1 glycoside hydrolase family 3 C-terminal domain-containing protein [Bacilli bacterium]MCH4228863.1 glycoside hydrolase family 3 C-terminal domain-containing protein [Bacilli bacterium]